MLASTSHAQVRQSTLYIDDGGGNFLQLVVSSLGVGNGYTLTFPDAKGVAQTGIVTPTGGSAATGDVLYYNATAGTWTRLSIGGAGTVLHGQASGIPTYGQVSLTSDVTGTLPVANGGTGSTTNSGAAAAILPTYISGDVLSNNGSSLSWTAPGSLAAGAHNTFYTTNGAGATGFTALLIGSGLTGDGISTALNVNLTGSNTWSGAETFKPGNTDETGLTVNQSSFATPTADIFDVENNAGTTKYLSVSSTGAVTAPNLSSSDGTSGFTIYNAADNSKEAQFDASGITTNTVRTYKFPDASGTLALTGASNNNTTTNFSSLGINIGATTPNTNLDVNGDVAVRADTNATSGTTLDNLSTSGRSNIDFTSANQTGNFTIDGFANGEPGKQLHIYNNSGHNMTIKNLDGSETAGNEINTLAGGDVTLNGNGTVNFVYDGAAGSGSWIMQPAMANTITGLAAVGITFTVEPSPAIDASTTDPQTDAYLNAAVIAGATYEVRGIIQINYGSDNNSFYIGFNPSAGSLSNVAISTLQFTPASGNTAIHGVGFITAGGTAGEQSAAGIVNKTETDAILVDGVFTATSAGTVSLIYHWGVTSTSDQLDPNSYLSFTRVK